MLVTSLHGTNKQHRVHTYLRTFCAWASTEPTHSAQQVIEALQAEVNALQQELERR